jgi:hypothetical protein
VSILGIIASSKLGIAPKVPSFESIATETVGGGGAATVEFTSIPATYSHLQIRYIARGSGGGGIYARFNSDSGSNYSAHNINGNGTTAGAQNQSSTNVPLIIRNNGISTTANIFTAGVIDVLDYTSTNKTKTLKSLGGQDLNGSGLIEFASIGWYASPAAITNIELVHNGTGFAQYSSFALYGIKGA